MEVFSFLIEKRRRFTPGPDVSYYFSISSFYLGRFEVFFLSEGIEKRTPTRIPTQWFTNFSFLRILFHGKVALFRRWNRETG